jgi:hypothetical protein
MQIKITIADLNLAGELNDSATAKKITASLPLELEMSRWGDEYYGGCGIETGLEREARTLMKVGEIAYWPPGKALCFFFGPTPVSSGEQPQAASKVNPVGTITSDCSPLRELANSVRVRIEKG